MARPTQPKDVKPKAEDAGGDDRPEKKGGGGSGPGMNLLVMALIIILCSAASSAASIYFLAPIVLKPLVATPGEEGEEAGDGEEGEEGEEAGDGEEGEGEAAEKPLPTVGPVIDLEEFTVNLKDTKAERYLRADLSIMVSTEDPKFGTLAGEEGKKWEEEFHAEMGHYVPAIRDIVIGALTRRTAAELGNEIGKEQVKEEIKRNVNALFHGERQVIRVNLENFIIQ